MIQVPQRGPGCQHFLTCAMCLTAPKFMGCGWCSGVCSWESECHSRWRNESCPPGITGVRFYSSSWDRNISTNKILNFKVLLCILCFIDAVLSTDCSPWWSNRVHGVWMGVPVASKACHNFQNPPGPTGADGLHCSHSQKQQHPVSKYVGLILVLFWRNESVLVLKRKLLSPPFWEVWRHLSLVLSFHRSWIGESMAFSLL